jgi:hypothetical protein
MATYAEQLASVQAAITAIENPSGSGGQEIEFEGKRRTRADLRTLYARERQLRVMVAREVRGGGIRMRRIIPL